MVGKRKALPDGVIDLTREDTASDALSENSEMLMEPTPRTQSAFTIKRKLNKKQVMTSNCVSDMLAALSDEELTALIQALDTAHTHTLAGPEQYAVFDNLTVPKQNKFKTGNINLMHIFIQYRYYMPPSYLLTRLLILLACLHVCFMNAMQ
jgi:hypothetical protein